MLDPLDRTEGLHGMWPARATIAGGDGTPKLHRHHLFGTGKTFGVILHHFVGSDSPTEFHDHPWSWGVSIVLRGGYTEERRGRLDSTRTRRWLGPGRFNLLLPGIFHRVELRESSTRMDLVHSRPEDSKVGIPRLNHRSL